MRVRAALLASVLAVMGLGACGNGGGNSRTIEVDYRSDDFNGAFLGYFPRRVTVTPGMTLRFHQSWTGEPHTVTFGTTIDQKIKPVKKIIDDFVERLVPLPDEIPEEFDIDYFDSTLPAFFVEDGIDQGAAHPCYLDDAKDLPLDNQACSKAQQRQVPFTGRHAYYSSGFIPFEGKGANSFEMKIADDAKEGTYFYYCNRHFIAMSGYITVKNGAKVESQVSLNRRGKAEADHLARPALTALRNERRGKAKFRGNLAGSGDDSSLNFMAAALEFTPATVNTKVGEKVTWTFIGDHSISFNVPPYNPIFRFTRNGDVAYSQGLDQPKGGWPGAPKREEFDGEIPPPGYAVSRDAGEWDGGGGLHSTGTNWVTGDTYSVTFTKAGTYPYACLIHPGMIGKVVVK